jgi:hypothetical protein
MTTRMSKPQAVIFDRDGTSFSIKHHQDENGDIRSWHDYNGLAAFDAPIDPVVALMRILAPYRKILMTSGREDKVRRDFEWAIDKHDVPVNRLFMRRTGDQRKDDVVKLEIYREQIQPYYDVQLVVDDRPSVCDAWRSIGLPVIQVTDPGILPRIGS